MNYLSTTLSRSLSTITITVIASIILTALLLIHGSAEMLPTLQPYNPVWNKIASWAGLFIPGVVINFFLVMLGGRLLFKFSEYFSLCRFRTMFPFMFYVMLQICNPSMQFISEGSLTSILILLAIYTLLSAYQESKSQLYGMSVGVIFGIIGLLWTKGLLYFPIFIIGLWLMRANNLKTLLATIIGLLSIYWLQFSYYYLNGDTIVFLEQFKDIVNFSLPEISGIDYIQATGYIVTSVSSLIIIFRILMSGHQEKVRTQASMGFIIWLTFASIVLTFFNFKSPTGHLTILYAGSALLLSNSFCQAKTKFSTVLFFLLIGTYLSLFIESLWNIL